MSQTTSPGSSAGSPPAAPPRPLRRSTGDRWIAGIASGFARYFDIDPVLVRVGFIALGVVMFPIAVIFYVACLFVMPSDASDTARTDHFVDRHGKVLAGVALALLAVAFLVSITDGWGPHEPWGFLFPLLVILGLVWLFRWRRRPQQWPYGAATAFPPSSGPVTAPTAPYPGAPAFTSPSATQSSAPYEPGPHDETGPYATGPYAEYAVTSPYPPWQPRERSALGPLTFGAALLTAGILVALDRADVVSVPTVVVLASALAVVGLGLVVGTVVGRSRGLIALGVVLSIAIAFAGVVHLPASNSTGDQTWAPLTAAEVAPTYEWGAGEALLDLTAVRSPASSVSTSVELGVGEIVVRVPRDAIVRLHAEVGVGVIDVTDDGTVKETVEGISRELNTTSTPSGSTGEATTFDLDVSVGIGHVEVTRA